MPSTLDFKKVEALRTHMLLNVSQMAKAMTVSRVTYAGWVKGKPIRPVNAEKVRGKLRAMLSVMAEQEWPRPEVIAMMPGQRLDMLLELMEKEE